VTLSSSGELCQTVIISVAISKIRFAHTNDRQTCGRRRLTHVALTRRPVLQTGWLREPAGKTMLNNDELNVTSTSACIIFDAPSMDCMCRSCYQQSRAQEALDRY
jgi:hypothetical protein